MTGPAPFPCDEGVIRAGPPGATPCLARTKPWVLAATILGSSMAFIDGSVVNVALPTIQADLGTSVRGAQWVVNGYLLTLSALLLAGGAAGDRFGRRRLFVTGVGLFTAASVACGLAPGMATLIAARAVQGVGGACLVPSSLAIITATFPGNERGRAIGTWAGSSALTTALGPVLGGWLVDTWSWRLIFLLNVPIALAALWIAFSCVPESRDDSGSVGVDWGGALLATAGLGAVAFGLTEASDVPWTHPAVVGPLGAGIAVLALFVRHESRTRWPMMPLGLFRSAAFSGANAVTLLLYFALSGALFFLPFELIRAHGYSTAQAGAAFLPFTLIMGGLSRWSGGLVERYGARRPLIIGPVVAAGGFALCAVPGTGGLYWGTFFPAVSVLGLGMAVSVAPLTTTVMGAVESRHAGLASGINNATARVAGMLAVALLGAVAVGVFRERLDRRLEVAGATAPVRQAIARQASRLAEAEVPRGLGEPERRRLRQAVEEAFVETVRVVMLTAAGLALLGGLCAGLTIHPPRRPEPRRT
jgi:EmrB/QacA subfamily drug resistance transporter